jgi:hypothetical protein
MVFRTPSPHFQPTSQTSKTVDQQGLLTGAAHVAAVVVLLRVPLQDASEAFESPRSYYSADGGSDSFHSVHSQSYHSDAGECVLECTECTTVV